MRAYLFYFQAFLFLCGCEVLWRPFLDPASQGCVTACQGGQVCNPSTAQCETPSDLGTGATMDAAGMGPSLNVLAGALGGQGNADDTGPAARFFYPLGVALDGAGNLYVADANNHTIRDV
jgi:hypothetical protein